MFVDPLELARAHPELSAVHTLSLYQRILFALALILFLGMYWWHPWPIIMLCVAISVVFYLVLTVYKLGLIYFSVIATDEIRIRAEEIAVLRDEDLPSYAILVPLYHESESVASLVSALQALDYPPAKMDIQLLLEEDDQETRQALEPIRLPQGVRITLIPVSQPRTKPKACNVGLALARGEYLVIYDAEDRPEPDQLKKAVLAFRRCTPAVICLQCKLNFYNSRQNWLTRWFTAEYSAWFDLSLPGLATLHAAMPLGGTSNHFKTAILRELHGWDAFNVTEDCDLGFRIARAGYASRMLDSTTWEEACSRLKFWITQRTRWMKGYMQTYLVHTRQPLRLARELGWVNFMHAHLLLGGLILNVLLNPIYWCLTLLWFVLRADVLTTLFPGPVFAMGAFCLFVGNFAFLHAGALGCFRRRYFDLVKYALLALPYWILMSYSGWRALWHLCTNPYRWEKTRHGLHTSA